MMPNTSEELAKEEENWRPHISAAIDAALIEAQQQAATPQFAVFDFDNTCIFRDVGQAVFRYQIVHLQYRLEPDAFAALLPPASQQMQFAAKPWSQIRQLLVASYALMWPQRGQGANLNHLPAYRLFTTLLPWFVQQARSIETLGPSFVLPFMAKLLAGFSVEELRCLAASVVRQALEEPLQHMQLTAMLPEHMGSIEADFALGLRIFPEMRSLMQRLQRLGIDCYILSASAEYLVEGAAPMLGFPLPGERIFGLRLAMDRQGRCTAENPPEQYPVTYRSGKTDVIRRFISAAPPLLVAGDADTDYEMLTMDGVRLRLLINRRQQGLIKRLYDDPHILLQSIDQGRGRFHRGENTIGP